MSIIPPIESHEDLKIEFMVSAPELEVMVRPPGFELQLQFPLQYSLNFALCFVVYVCYSALSIIRLLLVAF